MPSTRILIVDDHYFVRKGIQMFLDTEPSIEVVGEAKDGQEAFHQAERLQPDVILMDLAMPGEDGLKAITRIKRRFPMIKIIVLTMYEHEAKVKAAIEEVGADGYLLKEADDSTLLQAIEAVQRGEVPLHPRVTKYFVGHIGGRNSYVNNIVHLTEREKQVLQLVAKGLSNKAAAEILHLSSGTVKIHVSNILNKLNVSSRTEAAIQAMQMGLITIDDEPV